ncbi:hypothetical protein FSST1_012632 [Fusarium sambucinum]
MSLNTTASESFATETPLAESTATTNNTVAVDTRSETYTATDSQMHTITTSDAAFTTTTEASITTTEASITTTETSTAAPVPVYINILKNPAPGIAVCGIKRVPVAVSDDFVYLRNAAAGTRLDCYRSCVEKLNYLSLAIQENVPCELYSGSTGGTDVLDTA